MSGEVTVDPGCPGSASDHVSHATIAEPGGADAAVAGDGPEGGAGVGLGQLAPGSPGPHRAGGGVAAIGQAEGLGLPFLVGLGAGQHDPQALVVFGDVGCVEGGKLTAPQCSGKAD